MLERRRFHRPLAELPEPKISASMELRSAPPLHQSWIGVYPSPRSTKSKSRRTAPLALQSMSSTSLSILGDLRLQSVNERQKCDAPSLCLQFFEGKA
jgi:hypothetical protein